MHAGILRVATHVKPQDLLIWIFFFANTAASVSSLSVIVHAGILRVATHVKPQDLLIWIFFFANTAASVSSLGALFFANEGEREAQVTGDEAQGIMDRRKKRGALRRRTHKFLNLQAHSYLADVLLLISVPTPTFCWPWETWTRFLKSNKRLS